MNLSAQETHLVQDNSNKSILARGCDPVQSAHFAKMVPALIGNAEYIPTTDDGDFIEKLKARQWSVVYFAPGACRYNAVQKPIPGNNLDTRAWSLEDYKTLIKQLQGEDIQIVESLQEQGTITLLKEALRIAKPLK